MANSLLYDMLSRINNAYNLKFNTVEVVFSSLCFKILNLLYLEGYINGFYLTKKGTILVKLKYYKNIHIFKSLTIISKPGRKIYYNTFMLKQKYYNNIFVVVSTSQGLFTHKEAIRRNLGGLVLFSLNYI